MRAAAVLLALVVVAVAGCGDDEPELPVSGPAVTATPPPADDLKVDLATAVRELETYFFAEGSYTEDETLLGPAFPPTVTVKEADPDGFYIAAYDDAGIRYSMVREGEEDTRRCDPPDPEDCPNGEW